MIAYRADSGFEEEALRCNLAFWAAVRYLGILPLHNRLIEASERSAGDCFAALAMTALWHWFCVIIDRLD
jgi:hypothetical protein